MVKRYLRILENLSDEERLEKQSQIILIEVVDEADAKIKAGIYEFAFAKLNHSKEMIVQRHFEDADRNEPDEVIEL